MDCAARLCELCTLHSQRTCRRTFRSFFEVDLESCQRQRLFRLRPSLSGNFNASHMGLRHCRQTYRAPKPYDWGMKVATCRLVAEIFPRTVLKLKRLDIWLEKGIKKGTTYTLSRCDRAKFPSFHFSFLVNGTFTVN